MTLAALSRTVEYAGQAAPASCPVPFQFFDAADLSVILRDAQGVEAAATGYTVTGGAGAKGVVTFGVSTADMTIVIRGATSLAQPDSYPEGGKLPSKTIERGLDRRAAVAIEQKDRLDDMTARGLLAPAGETLAMLAPAAARAGRVLAFGDDGAPIASYTLDELGRAVLNAAAALSNKSVAEAVLFQQPGGEARDLQAVLRGLGPSLVDYRRPADASDGPAIARAIAQLFASRVTTALMPESGLGHLDLGKGAFDVPPMALTDSGGAYSFGLRGQGQAASVLRTAVTSGTAMRFNTYRALVLEDFGLLNTVVSAPGATTIGIELRGQDTAGHVSKAARLQITGFDYAFKVTGTTNGDFGTYEQIEVGCSYLFGNSQNKNAISHVFRQITVACREAILALGGAGHVVLDAGGANIGNTVVKYLEGAGVNGVHPQIVTIRDMKWEYGGGGTAAQRVIDATACILTPDNGGADTETTIHDTTYVLGDHPPGTPADSSYDEHEIAYIENGRHRINMLGGYIRGKIVHLSTFVDTVARSRFMRMRAAPLLRNLLLGGTGTHPLYEWQGNENQADAYRGGQAGMRCVQPHAAILWRHLLDQVVNTGVVQTAYPQGDGTTWYGADFTIDLTLSPINLPPLMTIEGLFLYVDNNKLNSPTRLQWFADAAFTAPIGAVATVAGGQRSKIQLWKQDVTVTDGRVRLRILKPTVGDNGTIGAIGVEYFRYFGNG